METLNILLVISIATNVLLIVIFIKKDCIQSFKIGYYEQTFKNNKHLFSNYRWDCINRVINKK